MHPYIEIRKLNRFDCVLTTKDPIVGISKSQEITLDASESDWRVNGSKGVIQLSSH
jgi:hypothetical protein